MSVYFLFNQKTSMFISQGSLIEYQRLKGGGVRIVNIFLDQNSFNQKFAQKKKLQKFKPYYLNQNFIQPNHFMEHIFLTEHFFLAKTFFTKNFLLENVLDQKKEK